VPGHLDDEQGSGFTGEPKDATGFIYLRARYYDGSLGRFVGRDPFAGAGWDPQGQNRYSYARNDPTTFGDSSGLCSDPGGPGIRYCIEAFIPEATASSYGTKWSDFVGDNRGPMANGGTYRFHQSIYQLPNGTTTESHVAGISKLVDGSQQRQADFWICGGQKAKVLGGRDFAVSCSASDGLLAAGSSSLLVQAPPVGYVFKIEERNGQAQVVSPFGTKYPSYEVWQYGNGDPRLVYFYDSAAAGANSLIDTWGMAPLP